jgi:predicted PhzF superfamily epimerase YddE/YHI9
MRLPLHQIDAFTNEVFKGNPAAVVPLTEWPDDRVLQAIALENNLSETAFFAPLADGFRLRWFTPAIEVDLCGHATLATAWLILNRLDPGRPRVVFQTRSGELTVSRSGPRLAMDFPARPPSRIGPLPGLLAAVGRAPREILAARDILLVYDDPGIVRGLAPDLSALAKVECFAVCATAPGDGGYDCVSRFFAPRVGVPEDPVTGSVHCTVAPYWAGRLGKPALHCLQASARGGELWCTVRGDRVVIEGECAPYLEGAIEV